MNRRMPAGADAAPDLITTSEGLAALCERLRQETFVTVDTEFMRERTYWPELCVVQLGGEAEVAVVDALAPGLDLTPLGALLAKAAGIDPDRAGRVPVQADLSLPGHSEVQVIGDLAALNVDGQPVPGIAPAAKQMGQHAARNVLARLDGKAPAAFRYRDYGSMATIGRHRAIGVIGGMRFSGLVAWWLWLFAHIVFLIGFRNRLVVLMDWASQYWTMQRHARVFPPRDNNGP